MYDFKTEWSGYLLTIAPAETMTEGTEAAARAWRIIRRPRAPKGYRFIYNHHRT